MGNSKYELYPVHLVLKIITLTATSKLDFVIPGDFWSQDINNSNGFDVESNQCPANKGLTTGTWTECVKLD